MEAVFAASVSADGFCEQGWIKRHRGDAVARCRGDGAGGFILDNGLDHGNGLEAGKAWLAGKAAVRGEPADVMGGEAAAGFDAAMS